MAASHSYILYATWLLDSATSPRGRSVSRPTENGRFVEKIPEVNSDVTTIGEERVHLEIEARLETRTRNASS